MEIPAEVLTWALDQTREWIREQRDAYRSSAVALAEGTKDRLRSFFTDAALDGARVRDVRVISNPPFLEQVRAMGLPVDGIDLGRMSGRGTPLHHGGTMALNAGFTAPIVMALGGWKTERMMRRYAAVTDVTLRAAAEAVSGAEGPRAPSVQAATGRS